MNLLSWSCVWIRHSSQFTGSWTLFIIQKTSRAALSLRATNRRSATIKLDKPEVNQQVCTPASLRWASIQNLEDVFMSQAPSQPRLMLCLQPVSSVFFRYFGFKTDSDKNHRRLRACAVRLFSVSLAWCIETEPAGFGSYRRHSRRHTAPARLRRSPLRLSESTVPPLRSGLLLFSELLLSAAPTPPLRATSLPAHLIGVRGLHRKAFPVCFSFTFLKLA